MAWLTDRDPHFYDRIYDIP